MVQGLAVGIEKTLVETALVIRIPVETLAAAANRSEAFYDGNKDAYITKVTDKRLFADSVIKSLQREGEDGSTPVTRMFDAAFLWVLEQGLPVMQVSLR